MIISVAITGYHFPIELGASIPGLLIKYKILHCTLPRRRLK
jgi:hypothetical protein